MKPKKPPALSSWLLPALAFTLLYCILHYIYCNSGFNFTIPVIIICSLIPGFLLGVANLFICLRRKNWNFWFEAFLFLILYGIVQIASYLYFYSEWYWHYETEIGALVHKYFPFILHVFCMIPGIIAYHLVGYWGCRRYNRHAVPPFCAGSVISKLKQLRGRWKFSIKPK